MVQPSEKRGPRAVLRGPREPVLPDGRADPRVVHVAADDAEALAIVRSFDPPGIACRDLQESLILQMDIQEVPPDAMARRMVSEAWDLFLRRQFPAVAKKLGVELAELEHARPWFTFRHVTLPMMSPVIFYSITLGTIGVLQYFLVPLVLNGGDGRPGGTTYFMNVHIYKTFFTFQNMSYGSAMAWLLFVIILIVTVVLFGTARYWVYYAGESRS